MKSLSILVSTVDLNLLKNPNFFKNIDFSICELIIIQQMIHSHQALEIEEACTIVSVKEKGLAKSRNRALALASCPFVLICDDDIQFIEGFEQTILNAYKNQPDAAIMSFQVEDAVGNLYKSYSKSGFKHNFRSIVRVNSIEISLQLSKFPSRKLFDENFGLGAFCPTGEDTIFAVDTYNAKVPCYFYPKSIVIHPLESSGKNFHKDYAFHRAQVYRRAFSWKGYFMGCLFSIKKYSLYKKHFSWFYFMKTFTKGFFMKVN